MLLIFNFDAKRVFTVRTKPKMLIDLNKKRINKSFCFTMYITNGKQMFHALSCSSLTSLLADVASETGCPYPS